MLSFLYVQGSILTNNDLSVQALLSDCSVDDTRPSKVNNKVTRYMERKTWVETDGANSSSCGCQNNSSVVDVPAQGKSMIEVKYEKKNGKMYGKLALFGIP